ncbi:MAG: sulfatase-like hydrolase/transferase [Thermoleophilaceae bacterium]|nr:sulfatase-like hydrolase/transferase [Thermoleophilaceae bacterium]
MSRRELLERGVHVAVLWALAVAQPLFDLLGRNPEFFATRGSRPGDIVAFALLASFAVPLVLVGLEWLAGLANAALAWALHLVFVAVLVAAIALQVIGLAGAVPAFALAVGAGALAALAYVRWPAARAFLTVLGPAPIVFLVLFLVVSDVSDLVFPSSADVQAAHVRATAPIVLVIFDELPVHSLMAANGRVDAERYPNFARLARDATWYRNTASVDQDTPYATPAILDGRLPRQERLPVAADHPQNIFSLLGNRYALHVREDATALCAPSLCTDAGRPGFRDRMRSLWDDLSLVYAHQVLPDDVERELPSVTETWGDFNGGLDTNAAVADTEVTRRETKRERFRRIHANLAQGRPGRFEEFVAGIQGGRRPRLHLIHILLPHVPLQYLPSGRFYRRSPKEALTGLDGRPGYGIPFVVEQAYQRHLLQLEASDRLLGALLDRLHEVGIYDRAVVGVVADHGISFRLGHDRRLVRPQNVQEIAPVPFFLKAPGQRRGRISDKPLQTIDVLPTIADLLGVRIPWKVDGRSALRHGAPARRRMIIAKKFKHTYLVDTPSYESAKRAALARKVRLFGDDIYAFGPRPDLIGHAAPPGGRDATVDPGSGFIPAHVAGTIPNGRRGGGRTVAVAVNGTVAATGVTFTLEGADDEQFSVVLPERSFKPGRNRIEVLLVRGERLSPL